MPVQELQRPRIETAQREQYKYYSQEQVIEAFDVLGIRSSFIEAMYVREDGLSAIAVARAGEDAAVDHFVDNPIVRGVDQLKTMYETDLLLQHFTGRLKKPEPMYLSTIENVAFEGMIIPPHSFNVIVSVVREDETNHEISGAIYSGDTFIMGADMQTVRGVQESVSGGDILLSGEGDRFSRQEVGVVLESLHYGQSRRLLGDLLVEEDGKKSAGLLEVNEEFSVFEGIEQITHAMLVALQKKREN